MRRSRTLFMLVQLSAPVVFLAAAGIAGLLLGRTVDSLSWVHERPGFLLIGIAVAVVAIGWLAMVLWGKLLVVIGLLTKEEARGYPYFKPWDLP